MTKWVYRLEADNPELGLWYDANGNYIELVKEIPGCVSAHLPMGYDERYQKDGRSWFSSTSNLEHMPHWFTRENAEHLIQRGFKFFRYLATEYVEYDVETTFIRDSALAREEMTLEQIYGEELR